MRGKLRIYLGPAPGVGKTFAMLDEGWRRRARGADVVVGLVVTHGRPKTAAQVRDLEIIPPRRVDYRGRLWEEVDVDAILARRPQTVLIDELAHSNVPGSAREKRWQDIEVLLTAGIEVISTVNIQHLESVNDVVNRITGVVQRETVPDVVVRRADQIELVDMSPEALQRRMAHGNIYAPEKVDAALGNYFRLGNLGALRELALLWVADRVEDSLQVYMGQHGIVGPWETRERVLVALTGAPGNDQVIRRAARIARRTHGEFLGLHVKSDDGLTREKSELPERHRRVLEELGGRYYEVVAGDVPAALVGFARAHHVTQLVLGTSRRSRWTELTRGSIVNRVIRASREIDVHVISTQHDGRARSKALTPVPIHFAHPRRRLAMGFAAGSFAVVLLALLVGHFSALEPHHPGAVTSSAGLLIFLGVVVAVAAIGGRIPALVTALASVLVVDWYLIPPYRSLALARGYDAVYLLAFVALALIVALMVEHAARQRVEALRARDESDVVIALAERLARPDPAQFVVEEIHGALDRRAVALLSPVGDGWAVEAGCGDPPITAPDEGERYDLRNGCALVMTGPPMPPDAQRLIGALRSYLEAVIEIRRLEVDAKTAGDLSRTNDLRNALLAAVSHDLRTPLASIKAQASGWLEPDVTWSYAATREFMQAIDTDADRLNRLVENLLDMSRLQSGVINLDVRAIGLDEIVPAAVASLGDRARGVVVDVSDSLPLIEVDAALLERAVANIVDNAVRHSDDRPVRIEAGEINGRVDLRIVDRGCGIPLAQRDRLFQPFQRLGDTDSSTGIGLGLAVSKGFVEAVCGEILVEDTPGGGITMVLSLPLATPLLERES